MGYISILGLRSCLLSISIFVGSFEVFAQNPIVTENALSGTPISTWGVPDFRDNRICGFSTDISVNKGQIVRFKIDVAGGSNFIIKIYRLGYYGGNGAALKANLGTLAGTDQPTGILDINTGLLDCRNWTQSAQWAVPADAVSGLYIAKLERTGGGSNHIAFVVRNDTSTADIYYQTSDATWQAYNGYGLQDFYDGVTGFPAGRAVKVSYNRPIFPYNAGLVTNGLQSDWYMNTEYSMIRWLERNGYNISYATSVDVARSGNLIKNHKIFMDGGHDEYWSKEQRDNVEAARNAGVNLAFFTGNEVYWKTRWEADGAGTPFRTLVCYKEGTMGDGTIDERACGGKCDSATTIWTGLWRTGGNFDAGKPENALTGQISWEAATTAIQVPFAYKSYRFWRNTSIANLTNGQIASLAPSSLGYEFNWEQYPASYPPGRITLSETVINGKTHKLSLYRHSSGALVFGAGTILWAWGLDDQHFGGTNNQVSKDMQQAMVNLFADMGVQPGSRQIDLLPATKSTDITPPSSVISFPAAGASLPKNVPITISGTATDANVVAGVEISTDGGLTWKPATGRTSWTFSFTPTTVGSIIIKSRGFDDSGNMEAPGAGPAPNVVTISVYDLGATVCPCTLFNLDQPIQPPLVASNDGTGGIELGMKFRSSTDGYITGLRYYKGNGNTGTHIGQLYSSTGTLLGQATYTNETVFGWQEVALPTPIFIKADTTYMAAVHSSLGYYNLTANFFVSNFTNNMLTGLANGTSGGNGVFLYTNVPAFPVTVSSNQDNYWVDFVFRCLNNTWLGTVSNVWENAANWSCGIVPDSKSNVFIKKGNPNNPIIHSNVTVKSLNMEAPGLLTIATGFSMKIANNP